MVRERTQLVARIDLFQGAQVRPPNRRFVVGSEANSVWGDKEKCGARASSATDKSATEWLERRKW